MIKTKLLSLKLMEIQIEGEIKKAEIKGIMTEVEAFLEAGTSLGLVMVMSDIAFADFQAFMQDVKSGFKLLPKIGHLDRVAVATDSGWMKLGAKMDSLLIPGLVVKTFAINEIDAARLWVAADSPVANESPSDAQSLTLAQDAETGVYIFTVTGRMTKRAVEQMVDEMEDVFEDGRDICLLSDLSNFKGFDLNVLFADDLYEMKRDALKHVKKYAIIEAPAFAGFMATAIGSLLKTQIKTFKASERDAAMAWLTA